MISITQKYGPKLVIHRKNRQSITIFKCTLIVNVQTVINVLV